MKEPAGQAGALRLAYLSPLPPQPTGIADYSAEQLPYLAQRARVTAFAERPEQAPPALQQAVKIRPLAGYGPSRQDFDLAIYHVGNSGFYHDEIYRLALRYPGLVVLHDTVLHDLLGHITIGRFDHAAYARELGYSLGPAGFDLAWSIRLGQAKAPPELALHERLVDRCLGVMVHSQSAANRLTLVQPERPVKVIPAQIAPLQGRPLRRALGLPDEAVIFASIGLVNAAKRLDQALEAFTRLRQIIPETYYLIVGDVHSDVNLGRLIRRSGLKQAVIHTGFAADLQSFVDWTATADVVVNLRYPTLGETSAAALRALATGRPLIVFDHGWYGELPESVCLKVPPMDGEGLLAAMLELARDRERREEMGRAAAIYAKDNHDPAQVAGLVIDLCREILDGINTRFTD